MSADRGPGEPRNLGDEKDRWDDLLPGVRPHVECVLREVGLLAVGVDYGITPGSPR